ncbi:MAG: hypothetical protein CMM59_12615 [Rhodospirillaceae bacterium]|nr:hypothetical protein [Rhodospirillaceae bacterium]|tara:strand:- start:1022 stop:1297 length:276 start_codon:yes stop_codon:yes gene_type:complete
MTDASGSDRQMSPQEEERQRIMNQRVARREQMVKQRVQRKQYEQARKKAIWAKRTAMGKLFMIIFALVALGGLLFAMFTWFGVNLSQLLGG